MHHGSADAFVVVRHVLAKHELRDPIFCQLLSCRQWSSDLKGTTVNAEDRPMSLVTVAVGSNSLLMSMLLHCSEKDVDASDTAHLRSLAISTRLHVDNNEQHLSCYGLDSSTSSAHPSVMPP